MHELATAHKVLINSYDNPTYSNFGMVALVHPGHLRLGISTSNASPALSSRLRQDFEEIFAGEFAAYLDGLAEVRQRVRVQGSPTARRALPCCALWSAASAWRGRCAIQPTGSDT